MRALVCAAALAALGLSAGSSMGAVVISTNFDSGYVPTPTSYTYSSNGPCTAVPVVDNNGVGGSMGVTVTVDSSGVLNATGQTYYYWGLGSGVGCGFSQLPGSTDLSQYSFSADVMGTPLTGSTAGANWQLIFQNKAYQNIMVLNGPKFALTSGWTTYTATLDTFTVGTGPTDGSLALYTSSLAAGDVSQIFVQIADDGTKQFTRAAGNIIRYDNISVSAPVPEPTILAGVTISSLGLMLRKRQK